MNSRWRAWLEGLLAFSLPVFPTISAGAFVLRGLMVRPAQQSRRWLPWAVIWGGYLAWILVPSMIAGHALSQPLRDASLGFVLATLATVMRPRAATTGLLIILLLFAGLATTHRLLGPRLWIDSSIGSSLRDALQGISRLNGNSSGWTRNSVRLSEKSWRLPADTTALVLSFEARGSAADPGWQWYTNDSSTRQERLDQDGQAFTRIIGQEASILRRVRLDVPLAERLVRITAQMRASEPVEAEGCTGIQVRTLEPWMSRCQSLSLGTDWSSVQIEHRFSDSATGSLFDLAMGASGASHVDVADLRIEVEDDGAWRATSHVEPAGLTLRVLLPGMENFQRPTVAAVPSAAWTPYRLEFGLGDDPPDELGVQMLLEQGTAVELRNITLLRDDGGLRQPVSTTGIRPSVWFIHPNLAGHSMLALGVLATWLAPTTSWRVLVILATLWATVVTGSRAALTATTLLFLTLFPWRQSNDDKTEVLRVVRPAILLIIAVASLAALLADRAESANEVSRIEIWRSAFGFTVDLPFVGIGADGFAEAWLRSHPGDARRAPTHAHNFWLQHGAAYGLFGLIAAIWLTTGLLAMAFRAAGPRGVALLLSILVLQMFDHTLLFVAVLAPVMIMLRNMPSLGSAANKDLP